MVLGRVHESRSLGRAVGKPDGLGCQSARIDRAVGSARAAPGAAALAFLANRAPAGPRPARPRAPARCRWTPRCLIHSEWRYPPPLGAWGPPGRATPLARRAVSPDLRGPGPIGPPGPVRSGRRLWSCARASPWPWPSPGDQEPGWRRPRGSGMILPMSSATATKRARRAARIPRRHAPTVNATWTQRQ